MSRPSAGALTGALNSIAATLPVEIPSVPRPEKIAACAFVITPMGAGEAAVAQQHSNRRAPVFFAMCTLTTTTSGARVGVTQACSPALPLLGSSASNQAATARPSSSPEARAPTESPNESPDERFVHLIPCRIGILYLGSIVLAGPLLVRKLRGGQACKEVQADVGRVNKAKADADEGLDRRV